VPRRTFGSRIEEELDNGEGYMMTNFAICTHEVVLLLRLLNQEKRDGQGVEHAWEQFVYSFAWSPQMKR
jgi:hypothetical protein